MRNALLGLLTFASAVSTVSIARADEPAPHVGAVSNIIYLNRCSGGCTLRRGSDDARAMTSTIPQGGTDFVMTEYKNAAGMTGTAADEEWAATVQCVREVYSPYNVLITDVKPTAPTYSMNIVAGKPSELGLPSYYGGVSPGTACSPVDNRITFTFANTVSASTQVRIWQNCWTIAQETAHSFGLDHAYAHSDGRSACDDPMTYRTDCGGQKFFRNDAQTCGEDFAQACECGGLQNPHLSLLSTFGPGTSIIPAPTLTVNSPAPGTLTGSSVNVTAFSQRGVAKVELWINGYKWNELRGANSGPQGQPESSYTLTIPSEVPDGVMDLVVKAKDDLGITTESDVITVTRGAPCGDAATDCLDGQKCDAGKCYWEAASGELGDECGFPQFCTTGLCTAPEGKTDICSRECVAGVEGSCEEGFECVPTSDNAGFCYTAGGGGGGGGICSAGESRSGLACLSLALFGVVLVTRRRRR